MTNTAVLCVAIVVAVVLFFVSVLQRGRRTQNVLQARGVRARSSDLEFETAFAIVAAAIGEDLGVDPAKLMPEDRLRGDLGYDIDQLGGEDMLEDAFDVVATKASVRPELFRDCVTLKDMAERLR